MTTPEQLAKWREDADIVFQKILLTEYKNLSRAKRDKGEMFKYFEFTTESVWRAFEIGYIRANQDNEQIMKLMEKAANISAQHARKQALGEAIVICNAVLAPTKASAAEVATHFRDGYISGVNRCINRLELLK